MLGLKILWLWCCVAVGVTSHRVSEARQRPVVHLQDQGDIRGRRAQDGDYYQFKGIPYATASPQHRFENVLPVPRWEGVRDADQDVACSQYDDESERGGTVGTEDCLVINVYTPRISNKRPARLPVMVFIHGGGFNQGSAEKFIYGPKRFVEHKVVLVTFNYRLGIFGFLCSGEYANAGLKDAVAVLEWVKTNINKFGGDPDKVTLFGQSAGSAMVEILALSKRTKGLFRAAIAQSGFTSSPWAFGSDPEEKVRRVAKDLGYEGDDREERIRVLRNASASDLVTAQEKLALMTPFEFLPVSPCIESINSSESIITRDPRDLIKSGDYNDIPLILGFTKDEAMLLYGTVRVFPEFYQIVQDDFVHTLPEDLQMLPRSDEISNMTLGFYFENRTVNNESITVLVDYFTDVTYALPMVQNARGYIRSDRKSPLYMYQFSYDGGMPFLKIRLNITNIPGVCHGDELGYMFTQDNYTLVRRDDRLLSKQLITYWTNFAKFRDPTPIVSDLLQVRWSPVTEQLDYLYMDRKMRLYQKPFPNRINYWDSVYSTFDVHS